MNNKSYTERTKISLNLFTNSHFSHDDSFLFVIGTNFTFNYGRKVNRKVREVFFFLRELIKKGNQFLHFPFFSFYFEGQRKKCM